MNSSIQPQAAASRVAAQKATGTSGKFGELPRTGNTVNLDQGDPLAGQTPVQIDEQLAALYEQNQRSSARLASRCDQQHHLVGDDYQVRYLPASGWRLTWPEVMARTRAVLDDPTAPRRASFVSNMADIDRLQAERAQIISQEEALEGEFERRGGWPRAFLVTGGDGHVHSSMHCSTCNRNGALTRFAWMTSYSGQDEDAIVAAAGYRACTVCYPSAPVGDEHSLPTRMFSADEIAAAAAREERAAAKQARDAARIAKSLTADGSEFIVPTSASDGYRGVRREYFKTEQAATQWAVGHMVNRRWFYTNPHPAWQADLKVRDESVEKVITAVAAKHGRTLGEVRAEFEKKVLAKARRDGWIGR